jgi:DNA-binding NtrC family response regulator
VETDLSILVIDDDPDVVLAARHTLAGLCARVESAGSLEGLEEALKDRRCAAVVLDMNFVAGDSSGRSGLDGLGRIQAADPSLAVVLMTAYGGVQLAVDALKHGADDFVLKPWKNGRMVEVVSDACALTQSRREARRATLDDIEREAVKRALAEHGGNISKAAEALGVTRPALYRKIEKHSL